MSKRSAFDELLESFSEEDRKVASDLAGKYPSFKEYGLRQSDYSRFMNENSEKIRQLEEWNEWRTNNWDDDHKSTKSELAKQSELDRLLQEKQDLELRIAAGGDEMDFAQLEGQLSEWSSKKGFITQDAIKEKETEVQKFVTDLNKWTAKAALNVPYLNQRHRDEFGEYFDPEAFLKEASDKNQWDLRSYYEKDYVVDKRQAKMKSEHAEELARVRAESEAAITKAREESESRTKALEGMALGRGPSDTDGPEMGNFQKQYLKLDKAAEGSGAPEVELGEGGVAAYAAREFIKNKAGR